MPEDKSRGYCFTINNYTKEDKQVLQNIECKYIIYGKEIGKKNTKHLQGYILFDNQKAFKKVKKLLPRAHIEKQSGTKVQAILYCMKDGKYIERGIRPRQGKRSDLDIIRHDIEKGVHDKDIAKQYFSQFCQYRRAFTAYRDMLKTQYDTQIVIYSNHDFESCRKVQHYKVDPYLEINFEHVPTLPNTYYSKRYKYIIMDTFLTNPLMQAFFTEPDVKTIILSKYIRLCQDVGTTPLGEVTGREDAHVIQEIKE